MDLFRFSDRLNLDSSIRARFFYLHSHFGESDHKGLFDFVTFEYFIHFVYDQLNFGAKDVIHFNSKLAIIKEINIYFNTFCRELENIRIIYDYDDNALIHFYKLKIKLICGEKIDFFLENNTLECIYYKLGYLENEILIKKFVKDNLLIAHQSLLDLVNNTLEEDLFILLYEKLDQYLYQLEFLILELYYIRSFV
jgi:hypothetical protein